MDSRTLSGLLLISSPIIMIVFWLLLGPDGGDVISAKYAYGIGTLGLLLMVVGLSLVKDEMAGGAGAHYAQVGVLLLVLGMSAAIVESALEIVSVEAASPEHTALFAGAAEGVGSLTTAISMLGLAVVGIAFLVQKNVHVILSALVTIVGIVGVVGAATSYDNDNVMMVPYIGMMISSLALGIVRLRTKA
jgi:hypothetical protein